MLPADHRRGRRRAVDVGEEADHRRPGIDRRHRERDRPVADRQGELELAAAEVNAGAGLIRGRDQDVREVVLRGILVILRHHDLDVVLRGDAVQIDVGGERGRLSLVQIRAALVGLDDELNLLQRHDRLARSWNVLHVHRRERAGLCLVLDGVH